MCVCDQFVCVHTVIKHGEVCGDSGGMTCHLGNYQLGLIKVRDMAVDCFGYYLHTARDRLDYEHQYSLHKSRN